MREREGWLPVGSVVRVAGGNVPVVIAGYMAVGSERVAEYLGLPVPFGRVDDRFAWFDRKDVEDVLLVGYEDARAQFLVGTLREVEPRFARLRAGVHGGVRPAGEMLDADVSGAGAEAHGAMASDGGGELETDGSVASRALGTSDLAEGALSTEGARVPWLPLGSVVLVAGSSEPLCIMGYLQQLQDGPVYDYCAQAHPRGFSSDRWVLFNRSDIELVLFVGYQDVDVDMALARLNVMSGVAGVSASGALPVGALGAACKAPVREDDGWLPIGSAVTLDGRDGLFIVAGYMERDPRTGRLWDYEVVPYPVGRTAGVVHCDRWEVATAPLVGYRAPEWWLFSMVARAGEEGFGEAKARSVRARARSGAKRGVEDGVGDAATFQAMAVGASADGMNRSSGAGADPSSDVSGAAVCPWPPLGSIVEVEGADGPLCVLGYMVMPEDGGTMFDLCARPYPEGVDDGGWLMLNRADITRTLFLGYQDDEFFKLARVLDERG